jgi:hypothetical protein
MKNKLLLSLALLIVSGEFLSGQTPAMSWAKQLGGTSVDYGLSNAVDASGNVYTTGNFNGTADFDPGAGTYNLTPASAVNDDIFISKLDASGNFVWAKRLGGTSIDNVASISVDASGYVYTTGNFKGTVDFDPGAGTYNLSSASAGNDDIFISKLDTSGNFVWAKQLGGTSSDVGQSITVDPAGSGDVYTTGSFYGTADFDPGAGTYNLTSTGGSDIFISKLDATGNFVWAKQMGGNGTATGTSIAIDPAGSGDIYTTGVFDGTADFDPGAGTYSLTYAGGFDIFISKLDASGNFVWVTDGETIGTLNMTNDVRTHSTAPFFKDEIDDIVRIEINGNGYTNETVIRFLDIATPEFDGDWDAHKLFGVVPEAPAIYSSENGMMAINTLPAANTVPVGVNSGVAGEFTITATETSEFTDVILEDLLTGAIADLKSNSYTFDYDMSFDNRFILHFTPMAVTDNPVDLINIYSSQKDVYVTVPIGTRGQVRIFNLMGQVVANAVIANVLTKVHLDMIANYVVEVISNETAVTKKVFIKKKKIQI